MAPRPSSVAAKSQEERAALQEGGGCVIGLGLFCMSPLVVLLAATSRWAHYWATCRVVSVETSIWQVAPPWVGSCFNDSFPLLAVNVTVLYSPTGQDRPLCFDLNTTLCTADNVTHRSDCLVQLTQDVDWAAQVAQLNQTIDCLDRDGLPFYSDPSTLADPTNADQILVVTITLAGFGLGLVCLGCGSVVSMIWLNSGKRSRGRVYLQECCSRCGILHHETAAPLDPPPLGQPEQVTSLVRPPSPSSQVEAQLLPLTVPSEVAEDEPEPAIPSAANDPFPLVGSSSAPMFVSMEFGIPHPSEPYSGRMDD